MAARRRIEAATQMLDSEFDLDHPSSPNGSSGPPGQLGALGFNPGDDLGLRHDLPSEASAALSQLEATGSRLCQISREQRSRGCQSSATDSCGRPSAAGAQR